MWSIFDAMPVLLLLAQEGGKAAQGEDAAQIPIWPMFVMIGVVAYFILLRPASKEKAARAEMLGNLKKNDRVITAGGIYGVIVNVQKDADDVTIRIDDNNNTRLRILRSAISRPVTDDPSEKSDS